MPKSLTTNINLLWGKLIIEELFRLGVTDICIAPGSRSTPLVFAASKHKAITTHCHFDERGLCYFALGLAKTPNKLVAIITTSGGAVANLHPGVIEAHASEIPLVILTADRPNELINCGANQAINQEGIFGRAVSHQLNLPPATNEISPQFLLSSIDHAIAILDKNPGPIHINCMFREPFYTHDENADFAEYLTPLLSWNKSEKPYSSYHNLARGYGQNTSISGNKNTDEPLFPIKIPASKVLVIIAQQKSANTSNTIASWASSNSYALLTDCQSSSKNTLNSINYYDQLLHLDSFKELLLQSELIIQFGGRIISKRLLSFIKKSTADYWLIEQGQQLIDPDHKVNKRYPMSPSNWLQLVQDSSNDISQITRQWRAALIDLDNKLSDWLVYFDQQHNALSEYGVIRALPNIMPEESLLFLANSMPIRLYDMFAEKINPQQKITVFSNRGASGIDGILATASGVSCGQPNQAMTLVIGDTSLLHDLNSFALAARSTSPLVIIVFNNDGGAIFNMLPIPEKNDLRANFYQMPHGYNFKDVSKMFGINYCQPKTINDFKDNYHLAITSKQSAVIEIIVPPTQTTDLVSQISNELNVSSL